MALSLRHLRVGTGVSVVQPCPLHPHHHPNPQRDRKRPSQNPQRSGRDGSHAHHCHLPRWDCGHVGEYLCQPEFWGGCGLGQCVGGESRHWVCGQKGNRKVNIITGIASLEISQDGSPLRQNSAERTAQ